MNKYKSLGVTINTGNGIDDEFKEKILKQSLKLTPYVHMIAEKENEKKHLHFQLWFDEGKTKGDIKTKYSRICSKYPWYTEFHKKNCVVVKICYSNWIEIYCEENEEKKLDKSQELYKCIPKNPYDYYPSEAEQEKALNKCIAVDKKFFQWAEDFKESEFFNERIILDDVACFLFNMMFVSKKYQVIIDKKARVQNAECLYHYINGKYNREFMMTKEEAINNATYYTNRERIKTEEKKEKEPVNIIGRIRIESDTEDDE